MNKVLALSLRDVVFTTVGILTFMSRITSVLSRVEHEKSFITSGPGLSVQIFDIAANVNETLIKDPKK